MIEVDTEGLRSLLIFTQGDASTAFIFYADSEFEFNEAYAVWFWRLF